MKIGIIGATGFIGNHIYQEALSRGHEIIAVSRLRKVEKHPSVTVHQETIFNKENLLKALKDVDLIISAYNPGYFHIDLHNRFLQGYEILVEVAKQLNKRIIMILSATSLKLPDGSDLTDSYAYEGIFKKSMSGAKEVYELYINDNSFVKTICSPPAIVFNGTLTKNYHLGSDTLIIDQYNDISKISVQDLAYAILNEVEEPKYINKRFTLGYK